MRQVGASGYMGASHGILYPPTTLLPLDKSHPSINWVFCRPRQVIPFSLSAFHPTRVRLLPTLQQRARLCATYIRNSSPLLRGITCPPPAAACIPPPVSVLLTYGNQRTPPYAGALYRALVRGARWVSVLPPARPVPARRLRPRPTHTHTHTHEETGNDD